MRALARVGDLFHNPQDNLVMITVDLEIVRQVWKSETRIIAFGFYLDNTLSSAERTRVFPSMGDTFIAR